jgi:hypothetical protein
VGPRAASNRSLPRARREARLGPKAHDCDRQQTIWRRRNAHWSYPHARRRADCAEHDRLGRRHAATQRLANLTQGCVAAGPGGTFVGIGPGFTANAQSIVLAKESGELRLVASGFNSISDCAYDRVNDVLYITDNADNGDFMIMSMFAAQSGDTVFAVPSASTASGLSAPDVELLPANSVPFAANVTVDAAGDVFVADSAGGGSGTVIKIVGSTPSPFASSFDFTGGLAFNPANGNLFVAENLATFDNQITQFTPAGATVPPVPFAGPSFGFGSIDLLFNSDGRLLASGAFMGDVVSFNPSDATSIPFVSGLNFVGGMTVDPFTRRVQMLSSTFSAADEDKSLHRFTPVDQLSAGSGATEGECLHEAYGLQVVDGSATCTDGAACDGDGAADDACLFPVGFCFNVTDPGLGDCSTASAVSEVSLSAKPASAAIAAVAAQVAGALPLSAASCFFSDGLYVPVTVTGSGAKKDGKAKLKVKASAADGRKDSDTFKLICQPAP